MTNTISSRVWQEYVTLRTQRGMTLREAIKIVGITYQAAKKFEGGDEKSSGYPFFHLLHAGGGDEGSQLPNLPIPARLRKDEANRALEDFQFFGERYYGMTSSPWMLEANETFDAMYRQDENRRYIVFNMPPEAGKTSFMERKMAQLTARDRAIRGLVGSYANKMAWNMMTALGTSLQRQIPWQAPQQASLGGAKDAVSTLWADYGRFRPEESRRWNQSEIVVAQEDGSPIAGKEATWTSYGRESRQNLGSRYDFIVWDDLVTMSSMGRDTATMELFMQWWDTEGETRLNMGGLLVLLGQRISATDLYRHCLDKMGFEEGEELELVPTGKKYVHICYQAHDEDNCKGDEGHKRNSPAWQPDGTGGCILEPRRVGWMHQMQIKLNNPSHYATQYQQEDGDPASVLIPVKWLQGGRDDETGELHPGCWDDDRDFWQVPQGLSRPIGIITVDPSPTKYWGIQAWVVVPDPTALKRQDGTAGGTRYLVCATNPRNMDAPGFLEYHPATRTYTGILNEWYDNFAHMGVPLKHVIFEEAAAQRWALQYEIIKLWYANHQVKVYGHKTHGWNKPDPVLGLPMIKPAYREGRVRLPRKAFNRMKEFLFQITHYSDTYRGETDQLMANWFLESNLPKIVRRQPEEEPVGQIPAGALVVANSFNMKSLLSR